MKTGWKVFLVSIFLITVSCPRGSKLDSFIREIKDLRQELRQLKSTVNIQIPYIPEEITLFGERVPLEQPEVREKLRKELLREMASSRMISNFLDSGRWFPLIEQKAREAYFPDDLKYLAVAESDLNPIARSGKGAEGHFQFIKGTGLKYLKISRYVDERKDPEIATKAAIKLLEDLYAEFGTWPMTLGGYNMHKDRLKRALVKEKAKNFYAIKGIPIEAQKYPFRIMAKKLIMENPKRYGYPGWEILDKIKYKPYPIKARIVVVKKRKEKIVDIAQRLGMTYYEFMTFNPQIRIKKNKYGEVIRNHLPKGKYKIYVKIKGVL